MIICPDCGHLVGWDNYYGYYYCYNCGACVEREKRCCRCTNELSCRANNSIYPLGRCEKYHRDAPDGGYYG